MKQPNHPQIVKRLRRAEGHLRGVIAMFDKERSCVDLVQQLHAVEKAVAKAKLQLIHDHVAHCLADEVGHGAASAARDLTLLTKHL